MLCKNMFLKFIIKKMNLVIVIKKFRIKVHVFNVTNV